MYNTVSDFYIRAKTTIFLVLLFIGFLSVTKIFGSILLLCLCLYILLVEWPRFHAGWLTPIYPAMGMISALWLYICFSKLFVWSIVVSAATDTGGYCCGKLFGKRAGIISVSPGKTIEGFLGAYSAGLIVGFIIFYRYYAVPIVPCSMLLVSIAPIVAIAGDILQSFLKRRAHIKDAGAILPGHGGFMDRLDSILTVNFFIAIMLLM